MPNFKKNTSPAMKKSVYKKSSTFKMKGVPYPPNRKGKINPNSEGNTDLKDGRSKSSSFQKNAPTKQMGHMGAIMGTGSNSMSMMGMPNQNMGGSPPGLKPRTNRKVRVQR